MTTSFVHGIGLAGGAVRDEGQGLHWQLPDPGAFENSLAANLNTQYNFVHALLSPQPSEHLRSIVLCGSTNAHAAWSKPAYSAAKAGLEGLMRVIAQMYGEQGIRCNVVAPGTILNPQGSSDYELLDELRRQTVLGECVTPQDVAAATASLTDMKGVTGQMLVVDAGQSIRRRRK